MVAPTKLPAAVRNKMGVVVAALCMTCIFLSVMDSHPLFQPQLLLETSFPPEQTCPLKETSDEALRSVTTRNTKILVSAKFGRDAAFQKEVNEYQACATNLHLFDHIYAYAEFPDWILNDKTWSEYTAFLQNKNHPSKDGGGYWFWKSVLIHHHLERLEEGDFLVYADTDLYNQFIWIERLMETMRERDANLALYEMPYLERQYSKRDIYQHYCPGLDPTTDESLQCAGGFVVLRKMVSTLQFVKEWKHGVAQLQLISPAKSVAPNIPDFIAHRHDQSIVNAVLKCKYRSPGKELFPDTKVDPSLDKGNPISTKFVVHTFRIPEQSTLY